MKHEKYYHLKCLGSYLHQDWHLEFSTHEAAIAEFKTDKKQEFFTEFCRELDGLVRELSEKSDHEAETVLWTTLDWYYRPAADGFTVVEWLNQVRQIMCGGES